MEYVHTKVSGSTDALRDKDASGSRLAKMRAAMHIGSVYDDWPMYSANGDDYVIGQSIGLGASSVVHQGVFLPLDKACAIKVIDLEAYGRDTEELRRETQLMALSKHPNVLRVRGCWVNGTKLHIATRLMSSGSMLDIMRFSNPQGFDEVVIATVLKQALEGLKYLHANGWLHRDLKAANILVDDNGTVLLGDFGVGVFVGETTGSMSNEGKRKSFVGTPCWMAPEVIQRKHYDTKADIWSFGITALELAHGNAPNYTLNPVKVLMRTMQDEPPKLDRSGGVHKYSKLMEDFICSCLQKNPEQRPTADKLLSHTFFKQAKLPKFLVTAVLDSLPPLADRQERRRRASSNTMQHYLSWDFESTYSRTTPLSVDKADPFRNFSSNASLASPHASLRSTKLVSIDGQHVLATDAEDSNFLHLHGSSSQDESMRKEQAYSQINSDRRRNRSNDITGLRKTVSFEAAAALPENDSSNLGSWLAPIGEKNSPSVTADIPQSEEVLSLDLVGNESPEISSCNPAKNASTTTASASPHQTVPRASKLATATELAQSKQKSGNNPDTLKAAPRLNASQRDSTMANRATLVKPQTKRESVFGKLFGRKESRV